ncbi:MAG: hypothetical protein ACRDR6_30355 [Pseudonocardiaceae bacterium]
MRGEELHRGALVRVRRAVAHAQPSRQIGLCVHFDPAEHLSVMLRRYGITPTQIWRHGHNRRGYYRADIARAAGYDDTPGSRS